MGTGDWGVSVCVVCSPLLSFSLQHYYAIASKATLLKPAQMPIPKDKFKAEFGLDFDSALQEGIVYNAIDACKYLGLDASGLDAAWGPAKKVKFGGGFYCAELVPNIPGKAKKIYVLYVYSVQGSFQIVASSRRAHSLATSLSLSAPHVLSSK